MPKVLSSPNAVPDPKQPSFESLTALLQVATAASNNQQNTAAARAIAFDLRTQTSAQLQTLNQAVFTGNTIQLQAAEASLQPGIKALSDLKTKLAALGKDLKELSDILAGIDKAVAAVSAL